MLSRVSVKVLGVLTAAVGLSVVLGVFGWQYAAAQHNAAREALMVAMGYTVAGYCMVVLPLIIALVSKVVRPVAEVSQRVDALLGGDYSVGLGCDGTDELAQLRQKLDTMLTRFKYDLGFAQGVLKGIDTPFLVVDTDERLAYTNKTLISLLEQSGRPEDHYGDNVAYFFYGDAGRRTVLRDSLNDHTVTSREVDFVGRKGRKLRLFINASPLFDLSGKLMGALCIYQDLTELRAREAEIMANNERVAEAVKASEAVSQTVFAIAEDVESLIIETSREAEMQTERAVDTASAMEQMNGAVFNVARSASAAAEQSGIACDKAREGAAVVEDAMKAIDEVAKLAEGLKASMGELGKQAEEIGQVMTVISDIADQTNLLALNAAIEAARAGDAGRGFAVVADEVRKLAEKTMHATGEVGAAISSIQAGARGNVERVEASVLAVQRSRQLSSASGDSLREIVELVISTTDQVQAIAAASEQQSATSEHINIAVDEVRSISQSSARSLNDAAGKVHELSGKAGELQRIIASAGAA